MLGLSMRDMVGHRQDGGHRGRVKRDGLGQEGAALSLGEHVRQRRNGAKKHGLASLLFLVMAWPVILIALHSVQVRANANSGLSRNGEMPDQVCVPVIKSRTPHEQ